MTLSMTNSFVAGGQIVLAGWDANFTQIKNELDAFPTNGAFGTAVVQEVDLAQRAITPAKIEDNIQFVTLPKTLSGTTSTETTHDDHLINLYYARELFAAVFSEGDFTGGEILFDGSTNSVSEKIVLPNGRIIVLGYKTCSITTSATIKSDSVDLTAHGFSAVYAAFPIVSGSKSILGQISELTCALTALTTTTLTVTIYCRSVVSGSSVYGYFYMVIGK
jgi:hypothetical protein